MFQQTGLQAPSFAQIEAQVFKRQQIVFCVLTLFVTATLLVLHTAFASVLGEPSLAIILLLAISFFVKVLECIWLMQREQGISETVAKFEAGFSIVWLFALAGILAVLTDRDETPYFVLLAIAILQCAYHFHLFHTAVTIAAAIAMIFGWGHHFYLLHPPVRTSELLEYGMISVIYALMGILVWHLVNQLEDKEARLFRKVAELQSAREKLASEERLAAVGRLASGIAHEIRNPVAMITSSLSTAAYPNAEPEMREEMFALAAHQAKRLEKLTEDFLAYARPSAPQRTPVPIMEILEHVAQALRMRGSDKAVEVLCCRLDDCIVEIDPFQVEGALVNLSVNALDATPAGGRVKIAPRMESNMLLVDVEDSGPSIPEADLTRIFEPFFTTKRTGTGLGLAIAKGIAGAHGGDVRVTSNRPGAVTFTMSLDVGACGHKTQGSENGEDTGRR